MLRIGAAQDFGSTRLATAVAAFHRLNPKIRFEITLATPLLLLEQVSEGKIDIGFVDNGNLLAKNYPVSVTSLFQEEFILACSNTYFDAHVRKQPLPYSELQHLHYVDYLSHSPVAKLWLKHHFKKSPPKLEVVFSAENVRAVIASIRGGMGAGVVPAQLVEAELKSGELMSIEPSSKGLKMINHITLTRRLDRTPTAREQEFVQFCREHFDKKALKKSLKRS